MENLYVESIVEKTSNGIDELIKNGSYIGKNSNADISKAKKMLGMS